MTDLSKFYTILQESDLDVREESYMVLRIIGKLLRLYENSHGLAQKVYKKIGLSLVIDLIKSTNNADPYILLCLFKINKNFMLTYKFGNDSV